MVTAITVTAMPDEIKMGDPISPDVMEKGGYMFAKRNHSYLSYIDIPRSIGKSRLGLRKRRILATKRFLAELRAHTAGAHFYQGLSTEPYVDFPVRTFSTLLYDEGNVFTDAVQRFKRN